MVFNCACITSFIVKGLNPVTVNTNSPIQDYVHPDDQTQPFDFFYCYLNNLLYDVFLVSITDVSMPSILRACF